MLITKENNSLLPYRHLSPSSMIQMLVDEKCFFKRYVLNQWDQQTSPALIIGSGFHKALEIYYRNTKDILEWKKNKDGSKEIKVITREEIINAGINEAKKIFGYNEARGIKDLAKSKKADEDRFYSAYLNIIHFDWAALDVIDETIENEKDPKKKKEIRAGRVRLADEVQRDLGYMESKGCKLDRDLGFFNQEIEDAKKMYIKYPEKTDKKKALDQLVQGINNYMDFKPEIVPYEVEVGDLSEFLDYDGLEMPLPLKGRLDLIGLYNKADAVVDYKFVTNHSDSRTPAYEIAMWSYYFIAQAIMGKKIKKAIIIEVLKREPKVGADLKKPDLQKIMKDNKLPITKEVQLKTKVGTKDLTIDEMKDILLEKDLIKRDSPLNIIEIDFEEEPEIIQAFIETYKEILNRSYHYFIGKTIKFLPNPKADFTGIESWEDFKQETIREEDVISAFQKRWEEDKVEIDFTK